jgi:subtilisin-like proprotein convertase family protein/subtilisin family serine protease
MVLAVTGSMMWAQMPGIEPALTKDTFKIRDAQQDREFIVAKDEVAKIDRQGRIRAERMAGARTADETRKRAEAAAAQSGEETDLVLYEKEAPRNVFTRRLLTREIVAKLAPGTNAQALAYAMGITLLGDVPIAPGYYIFETKRPGASLTMAEKLRQHPGVLSADPVMARQQKKRWVPNDPMFGAQWHLRNTGQGGGTAANDVNILNVWNSYRGAGIKIGIIDDGLQTNHPDLAPNVNTQIDYDWNGNDSDPNPDVTQDYHGTSCAGVAAGRGNNGLGICGAAPEATLVGMRLIGGPATDIDEADALAYLNDAIYVKSNSWGPNDDGRTLAGPGPLAAAALANAAQNGRGGKGTIFLWAAGNGGNALDNSNYDGYANSIYTIAVAAMSDRGAKADYSENGANLVITAPSSSSGRQGITTTDLIGNNGYNAAGVTGETADRNYTQTFGGTSSATPLAAGVVSLVLQANPNLGWRDVQEILIRSATKNSPSDSDWVNNGAGFKFNHKFGAGLINADAAVNLAKTWTNLGAQQNITSPQTGLSVAIPDNNTTGISRTFNVTQNLRVEHVTVKVNITHASRGHLEILLTSPSGTVSRLAEKHSDTGDHYSDWTFMTVRNWGESAIGNWTLTVKDRTSGTTGTLKAATLTIFGTTGTTGGGGATQTFVSADVNKNIPDNTAAGITSDLVVSASGNVSTVNLSLNIAHTYIGDLKVSLISPAGKEVVIHNNTGGSSDNIVLNQMAVDGFAGVAAAGTWKLKVVDSASADTGKIVSWSLAIATTGGTPVPQTATFSSTDVPKSIPDNNAAGVLSNLTVAATGAVSSAKLSLSVTHPYIGDLKISLITPAGTEIIVHNNAGGSADNLALTNWTVNGVAGQAASGTWKIKAVDSASQDVGSITAWSLQLTTTP